jgi:phospholipid/cholesterol/gamma-HCH transport system permease protein
MSEINQKSATAITVLELPEALNRSWVERSSLVQQRPSGPMALDFAKTKNADSAGLSLLYYLNRLYAKAGAVLTLRNIPAAILSALNNWQPAFEKKSPLRRDSFGFLADFGEGVWEAKELAITALSMLAEMLFWGSFGLLQKRDFRRGVLIEQMFFMGYKSIGIVCMLSFLIGVVLALQAAIQLNRYGAGIFLAPMIGISMIKELGPLLTAIIISGRNGSSTTAEIATMVVGEEIDALRTMGLNPIQFVVVPKFWAMTLTMPFLSLCATVVGIAGGCIVAIFYLGISSSLFIGELLRNIAFVDVVANIVKSMVFAWLIIWIGAFHGFKVKGGAEEVGRETTASVVTGIFIVIVADAIFSFIF